MQIVKENGVATRIVMQKPSDMHQHFRDDWRTGLVVPMVEERFTMAVAMPNLSTPITTVALMEAHRADIMRYASSKHFRPLMTMYLTDTIDPEEVALACRQRDFVGIKYYPRGLTTNSTKGIQDPSALWKQGTRPYLALKVLASHGRVFMIHAADGVDEHGNELDPYDQEKHFIEKALPRTREAHSNLKISIEHLSTKEGAEYMRANGSPNLLGCSLTPHHLLLDRRDVFRGGYHVHRSWMPAVQREEHKLALRDLAKQGLPFVWLGSDSAPHSRSAKECACCASGVMTAHAAIELYAEALEDIGALNVFEDFAAVNGPRFFGVEVGERGDYITLVREEWKVEKPYQVFVDTSISKSGVEEVVPFRLGETIRWKLAA